MATSSRDRFIVLTTASYALLGLAWIFLSDQLLAIFTDIDSVVWLSSAKGVFFVLATAGLFFMAMRAVPQDGRTSGTAMSHTLGAGLHTARNNRWLRYGFASMITLAMLVVHQSLATGPAGQPLLVVFMLPIVLSALLGGLGPGLLATALAALAASYLVLPPVNSWRIEHSQNLFQWAILIASGVVVSLLAHRLKATLAKANLDRGLLNSVVSGTSDAVFVKDRQGRYLLANQATACFVNVSEHEIVGQDDKILFDPQTARQVAATDAAIMTAGRNTTLEENVVSLDGKPMVFLSTKGRCLTPPVRWWGCLASRARSLPRSGTMKSGYY
jgi:PAS domain-containing protein